jgi:hypothetical protein
LSAPHEPATPPHDGRTQEALERLSGVIWRLLVRLDEHERRQQARQAQQRPPLHLVPPPDPSTPLQHPLEIEDPADGNPRSR